MSPAQNLNKLIITKVLFKGEHTEHYFHLFRTFVNNFNYDKLYVYKNQEY
jgi:hypothetical protein